VEPIEVGEIEQVGLAFRMGRSTFGRGCLQLQAAARLLAKRFCTMQHAGPEVSSRPLLGPPSDPAFVGGDRIAARLAAAALGARRLLLVPESRSLLAFTRPPSS